MLYLPYTFRQRLAHHLFALILFFSVLLTCLTYSPLSLANSSAPLKTIAITQIVGHASLDKVHQGIVDTLTKHGYEDGKTTHIIFENAQGSVVLATQIAQQFVAMHPDVIVAIATPSAQAALNAAKKTNIPVVFASVTNPIQAKLVPSLKHPGGNITGTRNVSPINQEIAMIKEILPEAKTIGVVINHGETNSVDLLESVIENAKKFNMTVKYASASNAGEVQSATASLMGQIDSLLLLQDNTVASALPVVLKLTQKQGIPVFATYLDAVKQGALAGLAFDEYAIGQQTGQIVIQILNGKKAGDIDVEDPNHIELAINLHTAQKLHLKINDGLIKSAQDLY